VAHGSPKHDAVWVRQLAAELRRQGYPAKRMLAALGLDQRSLEADGARIPFGLHAAFFEAAARQAGDPCLGLHFGQTRDTRDAGLLGYVGLSSPTVMDGLKNLARYRPVFSDAAEMDIFRLEAQGRLTWWFHGAAGEMARQCVEFAATNLIRAMRAKTGRRVAPVALVFAHPRDEETGAFDDYFGCQVTFGAPENAVEFRLADLALPLSTADSRLLTILRRCCEDVLARSPERPPSLVERVERLVADRLTNGEASMAAIAAELGMSARSLSRRLAGQGTSFHAIVEEIRRELAARYLHERRLSLTEIAFLLGYSEVSTFNHAFRRWTGTTPAAFRARG